MTFCFVNWAFIIKTNMGRVYYIGQGIVLALWALVDSSSRGPLLMLLVCTISYVYVAKATDRKARRGHAAAGEVESIGASPSLSEEHGNISSTVGPVSAESDATESVAGWSLYNTDFYAWTQQQAALLHDEKWQHVDTFNVMWEIKRLSLDQRNEINGRLRELVMQLLKWRYQPEIREPYYSVNNRVCILRSEIAEALERNPSLRLEVPVLLAKVYQHARGKASLDTRLPLVTFPKPCPCGRRSRCWTRTFGRKSPSRADRDGRPDPVRWQYQALAPWDDCLLEHPLSGDIQQPLLRWGVGNVRVLWQALEQTYHAHPLEIKSVASAYATQKLTAYQQRSYGHH